MKPFTFAFAIMACTGIAMAQTPATTNGGAQRGVPVRKPQPAQKPAKKPVKTAPIVNDFGSLHNTGGTIASGVNGSDDCATAPAISGAGDYAFDSTGATTGTEGQHNGRQNNDIWYEWTASGDGIATFSTCNDSGATSGEVSFDSTITLWDGAGCPTDLAYAGYNDDGSGCGGFSSHLADHPVTAGSTYMVQIGGWGGADAGPGILSITENVTPPPAANDECATAEAISGDGSFAFDNSAGTTGTENQTDYLCYQFGSSTVDNDVWFAWTATVDGDVIVETCGGTSMDSKIAISSGSCGALTVLACNDDTCGLQSQVATAVTNGSTYYVQVGNFPGAPGGSGSLNVTQAVGAQPGDECSDAIAIAGAGSFPYDNTLCTTGAEGQNDYLCYQFGSSSVDNDIWFSWTSDGDGDYVFDTCGSSPDTKISVYDGSGCPTGASLGCNDDHCGLQSSVTATVVNGSTYTVQCGNFPGSAGGATTLNISPPPPACPTGIEDECATAGAISGQGTFCFDNSAATTGTENQNDYMCYQFGSSTVDNDIWFAWTADADGQATIESCGGTSMDSKMVLSEGSCGALTVLSCNDDTCGLQSQVSAVVTNGSTYYVQVGNFPGSVGGSGDISISITPVLPPHPNDDCATTVGVLVDGANLIDTTGASYGSNPATGSGSGSCWVSDSDVWHSYTATNSGLTIMALCNLDGTPAADFDTVLSVHDACGGAELACSDDLCGLASGLGFFATAGSTYMVNTGGWSAGETGTGVLSVISTTGVPFCNGSGGACPCGNDALQILPSGCVNSTTQPASLAATGDASASASGVNLIAVGAVPNLPGVFFAGENAINGGNGVAFGDGLRCAGFNVVRLQLTSSDGSGSAISTVDVAAAGGVSAGDTRNYQYWYREVNTGGVCGNSHNLTNGVGITWGP